MNNRFKTINPYLASFGFCNAVADWPHGIWIEIVITGFSRNCSASLWFNGAGEQKKKTRLTSVSLLSHNDTQQRTRAYIRWRHRTHTHTHAGRGRREFDFCIFPIPDCPSSRPPGAVDSFLSARGPSQVIMSG